MKPFLLRFVACLFVVVSSSSHAAYTFTSFAGLGDLKGGPFDSYAFAVNNEGAVAGYGRTIAGREAFIFENGSITGLGYISGAPSPAESLAFDIATDGTIIGSSATPYGSDLNGEAFKYQNGVMTGLGDLSGGLFFSQAEGISADASVIVGTSISTNGYEAFSYQNGVMSGIGDLSGGLFLSQAFAVSNDNSTIVGSSASGNGTEAFSYHTGSMVGLGDLAGGAFNSVAHAVSGDGSSIVGWGESVGGTEAFIYRNGTMTGLGDLDGGIFSSYAYDISADGSIIVGSSAGGASGQEAVLWDADSLAMLTVQSELLLSAINVTADGWSELDQVLGISDDGLTIVGRGIHNGNSEAWIATIAATQVPIPTTAWLFGSALAGLLVIRRRNY